MSSLARVVLVSSLVGTAVTLLACGSPLPKVETSSAAHGNAVAQHHTFVIELSDQAPTGFSPAARSKNVLEMARPKVESELTKKGYVVASNPAEAELTVRLAAGTHHIDDQPTGRAAAEGAPHEPDEISTLVITIEDRKTKESLFTGNAKKEIHSREIKDEDVTFAVTEILEPVAPSTKR